MGHRKFRGQWCRLSSVQHWFVVLVDRRLQNTTDPLAFSQLLTHHEDLSPRTHWASRMFAGLRFFFLGKAVCQARQAASFVPRVQGDMYNAKKTHVSCSHCSLHDDLGGLARQINQILGMLECARNPQSTFLRTSRPPSNVRAK